MKDCKLISCIQSITQIEFHICLGGKSRLLFGVIESLLCEAGCNFLVFKGRIILSTMRYKSLERNEPPKCGFFFFNVSLCPLSPILSAHLLPLPVHQRDTALACYLAVGSMRINCIRCFLCGLGTENCSLTFSQVPEKYWKL